MLNFLNNKKITSLEALSPIAFSPADLVDQRLKHVKLAVHVFLICIFLVQSYLFLFLLFLSISGYSGKEIDPLNPWNNTGKQLDLKSSEVLSQILGNEAAKVEPKIQSQ